MFIIFFQKKKRGGEKSREMEARTTSFVPLPPPPPFSEIKQNFQFPVRLARLGVPFVINPVETRSVGRKVGFDGGRIDGSRVVA